MDSQITLWVGGVLMTALFTISGGAIAFVLKHITDTLKSLSQEIALTSKETQGRINVLELSLATIKAQHDLYNHQSPK